MAVLLFLSYLFTAVALLIIFIRIYVRVTPYNEFDLIEKGNVAAAVALSGAVLGFSITLAASIYFTHSYVEMGMWAVITTGVQLALYLYMRKVVLNAIEAGRVAPAVFLSTLSVAMGLLNAASISS